MRTTMFRTIHVGLVVFLVFASWLLLSCQKKTDTPTIATGPLVDSIASADGVMIHYEAVGEGEPTLVFVHGWNCDRSYWKNQVDEFAKTHQVVTIDMGGHGESGLGREDWTIESFGADVAAVVNKLNPDKVVLIGHSLAGGVNLEATLLLLERVVGLVGADTYHELEMALTPEQVAGAIAPFKADFVTTVDNFVRGMFAKNADSSLEEWVISVMCSAPPAVAVSAAENYFATNPAEVLKKVRVPIRAINAERPPTNIENNQKLASSFEVKIMLNVGHFVMLEDPATFNKLLHETISELTGNSGISVSEK